MREQFIRRPDYVSGPLTDAEKEALRAHADMWIARIMRTDPIDGAAIADAIHRLYAVASRPKPIVVVVPSPLVAVVAGGLSAAIWYLRDHATWAATGDATRAATRAATRDATEAATRAATGAATRAATRAATGAATGAATWAATGAATEAAWVVELVNHLFLPKHRDFALSCVRSWDRMFSGGNMWAQYDAYLTAARDVLGLQLPQHAAYQAWEDAAIHGGPRIVHRQFCIVSDFPVFIKTDDRNLPHCEDGPSHEWRDGWRLYHWHGIAIPPWFLDKSQLTAEVALKQTNAELRRAACEIIGWHNVLAQLGERVIDIDPDPQVGVLVEVTLEGQRERFVKVRCGTGRDFAIPVPLDVRTALEANAWTYGIEPYEYKPEVRT